MIAKQSGFGIILIFYLFSCTTQMDVQASKEEETYFKEVVKRRVQGRYLINNGIYFTKGDAHLKVYQAIAKYYDQTDCFFSPLLEIYPTLSQIEEQMGLGYTEIDDAELVNILQSHIHATLQLYRGGIMKGIDDE